jgi:hypothetical protein
MPTRNNPQTQSTRKAAAPRRLRYYLMQFSYTSQAWEDMLKSPSRLHPCLSRLGLLRARGLPAGRRHPQGPVATLAEHSIWSDSGSRAPRR